MLSIMAYLLAALSAVAGEAPEPNIAELCTADHARLCSENSIQSDGAMRCLMDRRQEVSSPCRDALNARRQWVQTRVRAACTNEIVAYCARDRADPPIACLRRNESRLSRQCEATLPHWMS
jgi:hypothetical protein